MRACGRRPRRSTVRWVSSSSLELALMSKSRILAKSAACSSNASSACPQEEIISTSIWRRSEVDSGRLSCSLCCSWNAFCSVSVEWFIARVNGRVRSGPNSATAMSSSSLPRRIDSSVETSSSCASFSNVAISRRSSCAVLPGSIWRADSRVAAESFFVLRLLATAIPPPAKANAPAPPASHSPPEPSESEAAEAPEEDPAEPEAAASTSASAEGPYWWPSASLA